MILEIASFDIIPNKENLFKAATKDAIKIISHSKGFVGIEFQQCLEDSTKFLAFIKWQTLEDHTIGFRESRLFLEWRAILSPFFNSAPTVLHYNSF